MGYFEIPMGSCALCVDLWGKLMQIRDKRLKTWGEITYDSLRNPLTIEMSEEIDVVKVLEVGSNCGSHGTYEEDEGRPWRSRGPRRPARWAA